MTPSNLTSRRDFMQSVAALGGSAASQSLLPSYGRAADGLGTLAQRQPGSPIDLTVRQESKILADRDAQVAAFNGSVPVPSLRLQEGLRHKNLGRRDWRMECGYLAPPLVERC